MQEGDLSEILIQPVGAALEIVGCTAFIQRSAKDKSSSVLGVFHDFDEILVNDSGL